MSKKYQNLAIQAGHLMVRPRTHAVDSDLRCQKNVVLCVVLESNAPFTASVTRLGSYQKVHARLATLPAPSTNPVLKEAESTSSSSPHSPPPSPCVVEMVVRESDPYRARPSSISA